MPGLVECEEWDIFSMIFKNDSTTVICPTLSNIIQISITSALLIAHLVTLIALDRVRVNMMRTKTNVPVNRAVQMDVPVPIINVLLSQPQRA